MNIEQPVLKQNGLFLLLLVLGMTAPLSIDMYLAAFPLILVDLHTTPQMLSFTLIGFSLFMAIGMLLIGPLSDKFGRKSVLLASTGLYILGSLGCIFTPSIEFFIVSRSIQAFGAGGMISTPMAIVKDTFNDQDRTKMIATLQMFTILAPTIAPILGAVLIKIFPWQASFVVLTLIASSCFVATLFLKETLIEDKRLKTGIFKSILSIGVIMKHKGFMSFLSSTALITIVFMAYLSVSSYIYIKWFGLSETSFSFYFAMNSLLLMVGPKIYLYIKPRLKPSHILKYTLGIVFIGSLLTVTIGKLSPILFLICFAPVALSSTFLRSFSTDILLAQPELNAGASVSTISFTNVAFGAFGMLIASSIGAQTQDFVGTLGGIGLVVSALSFIWVSYYTKRKLPLAGYH